MKIGLFTDPHYCSMEITCKTRRPVLSFHKIQEAMNAFSASGADLVLCLGDLVDDCGCRESNCLAIRELSNMIHSYDIPFFSMMGNHDYQNFTKEEFNLYTDGACPPLTAVYGHRTFIFLDANYTRDGKVYEPGKVEWTNTKIPEDQLISLQKTLAESSGQDIYVFTHQNLDPGVDARHIIANACEIRTLLEEAGNVKMVISGHYHPGHEAEINGIRYLTLPAMCEGEENRYEIMDLD